MCACVYCDVSAHMVCGMVLVWGHKEGERGRLGHTLHPGVLQDQPSVRASSLSPHYMEGQEFHFPLPVPTGSPHSAPSGVAAPSPAAGSG